MYVYKNKLLVFILLHGSYSTCQEIVYALLGYVSQLDIPPFSLVSSIASWKDKLTFHSPNLILMNKKEADTCHLAVFLLYRCRDRVVPGGADEHGCVQLH